MSHEASPDATTIRALLNQGFKRAITNPDRPSDQHSTASPGGSVQQGLSAAYEFSASFTHRLAADKRFYGDSFVKPFLMTASIS